MDFQRSAWTYETGATGGAGVAFVAGAGGAIYLNDPAGQRHRLIFGGLGLGWSFGFRIPRLPKLAVRGRSVAGAGSITDFPSAGLIYRSTRLPAELTLDDVRGAVVFVEGGLGLVGGAAGDAMLFGIDSLLLVAALGSPALGFLMARAIESATGAAVFGGVNVGVQAGGGIAGMVGYMR